MQSRTIDLDGPLHYADFGGTGPTIVCVHGLGGSHANWIAVGPRLAGHSRVLAPDLAGFGRTPPDGRSAAVPANRALLDRFIDAAAGGGPVILIGNSMGGAIAMLEASARPEKVGGLVLVDPALPRAAGVRPDLRVAAVFGTYALPAIGEEFVRRRSRILGAEGLVRETLRLCCVDPSRVPREAVEAMIEVTRERLEMPWATHAFLEAARSTLGLLARRRRYIDMMRSITAPTLIVQGSHDRLVPLAAAQEAARLRPDWTLEVFEGVGHIPQLEVPERFVDTVGRWLAGAGRAAVAAAE
jgi:pimeloyl-ACP methyl ester carboxylesterase